MGPDESRDESSRYRATKKKETDVAFLSQFVAVGPANGMRYVVDVAIKMNSEGISFYNFG